MQNDMVTVAEVSKYLRVSPPSVYKLINNGELPHTKVGCRLLVPKAGLLDWIMANTSGGVRCG